MGDWHFARIAVMGFPFPQITTGDLDIAVVGQLLTANLPLNDEFSPGPVNMAGFNLSFRCRSLRE
jgi:hypothetical protein